MWTTIGEPFLNQQSKAKQRPFSVECRCECGVVSSVHYETLVHGGSSKCVKCRARLHGSHRESKTRLYVCWISMKARCERESCAAWPDYGGRGIVVCEAWSKYENFRDWSRSNGYSEELQIDRRDNNGPYSPENCRWVTQVKNANNKRSSRLVLAFGKLMTVSEWSREPECAVLRLTLTGRLDRGWEPERAISKPSMLKDGVRR